jgi:hypothetical protein
MLSHSSITDEFGDEAKRMTENPYQTPAAEEDPEHIRLAKRWTAAPALGISICGACCVALGLLFGGLVAFVVASIAYHVFVVGQELTNITKEFLSGMAAFTLLGLVYALVGWLAYRNSRHLRNLTSTRGAHIACILGMIMYPLCLISLPLGVYGLIVLRRQEVREVLQELAVR